MGKIIIPHELENTLEKIRADGKSIVLTGGCFDILHVGHIKFLKEAKKLGHFLFVLLESDEKVKKLKGQNRPYFPQEERAEVLSSISFVDYIILLPFFENDDSYNQLISKIKPSIVAVTAKDPIIDKKKNQVESSGGKICVIPYFKTFSSSRLAKLLGID